MVLATPGLLWKMEGLPARPSASVQKIKVATMRCGCTWTLLAIRAVGPAHTRLTRRKADTGCAASIGPPASPQTRNGPLLVPFFSVGMGPFGRSWGSKCRGPSAGRTPCMTMKTTAHFIFVVCTRIYASSSSACDASRTSFRDRMRPRQVRCVSSFS